MIENTTYSLTLNAHSYLAGERMVCQLTVSPEISSRCITNVSLDIFRIDSLRDQFAFGFGKAPRAVAGKLEVDEKLPANFAIGLYKIDGAIFTIALPNEEAGEATTKDFRIRFPAVIFEVRTAVRQALAQAAINLKLADIVDRRSRLARKPLIANASQDEKEQSRFLVYVFGAGSLIHEPQQLEGFVIMPLRRGWSHREMWAVVNDFLQSVNFEPLPFIKDTEHAFAMSSPVLAIAYPTVVAANADAALEHCRHHAEWVFRLLGIYRGQKPRAFAYVASQYDTNRWWHRFDFPGYRGNLISGFNPAETANSIERMMPRLETNPFLRLIVSTYSDATAEHEYGFALLRYWSVLELVAERQILTGKNISHPDGSPIFKSNRKHETTSSKHGRVYAYILAHGEYKSSGSYVEAGAQKSYHVGDKSDLNALTATDLFTLWDMVHATYAIRNAIAHEGQFDVAKAQAGNVHQQLAARLRNSANLPDPLDFVKKQALAAIWREV